MSQLLGTIQGNGGGGATVDTLTGNTGGAITPQNHNINVVGDTTSISVAGNNATATLTISAVNKQFDSLTTNNATPTNLITFAVAANTAYSFVINLAAAQSDYSHGAGGTINIAVRRAGAGAIAIGAATYAIAQDFLGTFDVLATVSGNNFVLTVTGLAATVINWKSETSYVRVP